MGTWVAIEARAFTEGVPLAGVEAAYLAVGEVERQLHPHREGSDIRRLNDAQPGEQVPMGILASEVLRLARSVYEISGGIFDPCLPSRPGRLCDLTLSQPGMGSAWASHVVPLALDLGGIAKGYAIDQGIEAMRAAGCTGGVVNAGGDLRVFGCSETVLVRARDGHCVPVTLNDEALAVSDLDVDLAGRPAEHRGYYDRSGPLLVTRRSAAVLAASAAIADALTKCALLARPQRALHALRSFHARLIS
ncbi:MAG: FAD:protein FMN transferase [Gammaproteobacteria bacterium]|nr:FAD:protein FMN transferase [Gammaproteobacteria bacterium]